MTFGSCLFCVLVASTAIQGQTPSNPPTSEDTNSTLAISTTTELAIPSDQFVVELNFALKEEQLSGIVNYLLLNDLDRYKIKTADILQLSGLEEFTLDQTLEFLNRAFGLSKEKVLTIGSLEVFLNAIDIKFSEFYSTLQDNLNIDNIEEIEAVFNIDSNKLIVALARGKINPYDVLKDGVYNEENANKALELIPGKTWDDIFQQAKKIVYNALVKLNPTVFVNILKSNGWNSIVHKQMWQQLPVTPEKVYAVEIFKNLLEEINQELNKNITIAVLVDANKLVLHKTVYDSIDQQILGSTVQILANGIQVEHRNPRLVGNNIYELELKSSSPNSISITSKYDQISNCFYFLWVGNEVLVTPMDVNKKLEGAKEKTVFQVGAPLVCNNQLYGLAREETTDAIIFDRFYTAQNSLENSANLPSNLGVVFGSILLFGHWVRNLF